MNRSKPSEFKIDVLADLNKWRMFIAIGELGSLTRAAMYLDSNQSLLSRQLNALERECRGRLFNRTGRGVELSELGARLFPQVRAILESAETLEQEIVGREVEPRGRVTVGLLPSIGLPLIGRLFRELRDKLPQVRLKVLEGSSGQVEEWLNDARVDIAILYRYKTLPETEQALAIVDSYLIGRPGDPLSEATDVTFAQLDSLPFILPSAPNGLRTALDSMARQMNITLEAVIDADSLPLQKSLVMHEGLYTVLPLHAVWSEVRSGQLQAARITEPRFQRTVSMAMAKTKGPSRAVRAVASQIAQSLQEMQQAGMLSTLSSA